jgi:uncharacterized protein YjeT (DUF2065 family)
MWKIYRDINYSSYIKKAKQNYMKLRWSLTHFLRIFGGILDVIGAVIIAVAVVNIHKDAIVAPSLRDLEDELNKAKIHEGHLTLVGVVFVIVGFLFLFSAEIVSWVKFSNLPRVTDVPLV